MECVRDYAMYAAVFGLFSFSWFGWAQEKPRPGWRNYLGMAAGAALLVCLVGVYLSVTNWHAPSALSDRTAFQRYLLLVSVEFALALAGALVLLKKRRKDEIAPWIALIVGLHFFGLKNVFADAGLSVLAVLLIVVALVSRPIARKLQVASSAITGIGVGTALFAFAILGLIRFMSV
ncbi:MULTISPECIES: hypothetical protein [Brevibacillus]|nr:MULTISPECIES: hypothetical protein [Brevibacillus]ELK42512.1 hypothetical protein D478_08468 [Brevibacillus agri BAB-2500]EJL46435.1 hypothetical protein PMI08_01144 [Brevibacillus sp. CF112]MBG9567366.1 hypothetical protein [Brevibacillus agri]MDR9506451.1 hypothetical protein [Brevibacillus agri]WHX32077.1 hypothetical protein QNK09_07690 [Brevibacillus agri]